MSAQIWSELRKRLAVTLRLSGKLSVVAKALHFGDDYALSMACYSGVLFSQTVRCT